jgi:arylformamidase
MGHSAGAHLVDLLAADPKIAFHEGAKPWLGTVSLDTATLDMEETMRGRHYGFYDAAFGKDPAYWAETSPIHRLKAV